MKTTRVLLGLESTKDEAINTLIRLAEHIYSTEEHWLEIESRSGFFNNRWGINFVSCKEELPANIFAPIVLAAILLRMKREVAQGGRS